MIGFWMKDETTNSQMIELNVIFTNILLLIKTSFDWENDFLPHIRFGEQLSLWKSSINRSIDNSVPLMDSILIYY